MRGSTIFTNCSINRPGYCYNGDYLIGLIHYSIDQPNETSIVRKYYHCLVLLNPVSLIPIIMTSPFTFCKKHGIEFCIGMKHDQETGIFTFWVSIMDQTPTEFFIHQDKIDFNILVGAINNTPRGT